MLVKFAARVLTVWLFVFAPAAPIAAQTVELSTRTFWLGERPGTLDEDFPFIALRRIAWIEAILATDPVLKDAVFHIEQTGMSVAVSVAGRDERDILLGSDRLPPQFDLSDYMIYGPPVATARDYTYLPTDAAAGFKVRCVRRDDVEHMSLCVLYGTYAPDDRIWLKARLYFPPDPADAPTYFQDVAERMREVAYCLDVTDEVIDVRAVHPTLTGCRKKPIS